MNSFRFEYPEFLFLLLFLPLFWFIRGWFIRRSRRRIGRLVSYETLAKNISAQAPAVRLEWNLWLVVLFFLILTLANPQYGLRKQNVQAGNAEIIIALDVSSSMAATDIKPDRLSRSQLLIRQITDRFSSARIGLICFAGEAYLQTPLTTDVATVQWLASMARPDRIPSQGTDLGAAIDLAIRSFPEKEGFHKLLILITDGEDHEGNGPDAAARAAKAGISIVTIPVGSEEGAFIPDVQTGGAGFKTDREGKPVKSKPDRKLLKILAEKSSGDMLEIHDTDGLLEALKKRVRHIIKKDLSFQLHNEYESRYQWPLLLSILVLIAIILKPYYKVT
jgi:Ca-activated chloride channel family protein